MIFTSNKTFTATEIFFNEFTNWVVENRKFSTVEELHSIYDDLCNTTEFEFNDNGSISTDCPPFSKFCEYMEL